MHKNSATWSLALYDAMWVVRIIIIPNLTPPTFLPWEKRLYNYIKQLPGNVIHIIFNDYEEGQVNSLSKGREAKSRKQKIAELSQRLLKVGEWTEFLTNSKNTVLQQSKNRIMKKLTQESFYIPLLLHQLTNQGQVMLLQTMQAYISCCYMCLSIALQKCTFD